MTVTNPTPQRQLRGHLPTRPTPRLAASGEHHAFLARHLTTRDRWLARMLYEHRVFTTHQIVDLAFPSARAANHRLRDLYQWRVLDRFQPFVTIGAQPMHYVLDVAGAATLAFEEGIDPRELRYRHDRAIGIAYSLRLAHTIGTNGFFTALIAASRQPAATGALTAWWSETRCARHFGDLVRPDGYGRWHDNATHTEIEWFLEFDFGTETLPLLASKLRGYHQLAAASGITTPVLVCFPTTRRENAARRTLADALANLDRPTLVPLATSSADLPKPDGEDTAPAGMGWLPLPPGDRQPRDRTRLADLPHAWPPAPIRAPRRTPRPAVHQGGSSELPVPAPLPPGYRRGGART